MKVFSNTFPAFRNLKMICFLTGTMVPFATCILNVGGAIRGVMLHGRWLKIVLAHFLEVRLEQHLWAENEHFQYFKILSEYSTFGGFRLDSRLLTVV